MTLSKRVVETLIDLVEIKLSCIEVHDREDASEKLALELARRELAQARDSAPDSGLRRRDSRTPLRRVPDTAGVAYRAPAEPGRLPA